MAQIDKNSLNNPFSISLSQDEVEELLKSMTISARQLQSQMTSSSFSFGGPSPTSNESKGMYEYQEPERDEQGTFYGYKVLKVEHGRFVSPSYPAYWSPQGKITSDREPREDHMHGIHCTKRPDHPELEKYARHGRYYGENVSFLVKCALSGTIVETDQGFRAEHADIIGVLVDGYWKSYSDYQERSRPNPRRDSYEDYEKRIYRISWIADYPFDPNP